MRRSLTRATAVTTAVALACTLLAPVTALADEDDPVPTEEAQAEQTALELAAETGEPVPIEELLQERRDVVANPDGTFTATEYVQPVRVRRDSAWVEADPTLEEGSDGRLRPVASTIGLSLSNGGDGPLATLTRAGKQLELGPPTPLPEPSVEHDTATYAQVLPGVDLVVRAAVDGFSQVLVVADAEAAAQPEIAELQMDLAVDGLQVEITEQGGIEATDESAGGAVFEAPTPLMWDSGGVGGDEEVSTMSAEPAGQEFDLTEGPLESSKIAEIDVTADNGVLNLVPDEALLQEADTNYPVYIDPVWKTSTSSAWAMVSSGYRGTSYWKFSGSDNEGSGRCPQLAGDPYYCQNVGIKRLFYRIPTSTYADKQILSAEFAVTLRHTYDSTPRAVRLYRTGGITSSTTWNNQPSWSQSLDTKSPTTPAGSCTSTNQNVRFDASDAVEWAADRGRSTTTFGLRSVNEDSYSHWKRFCDNAHLEVKYNTAPKQPRQTELQLEPGGACVYGNQRPYVDEPPRVSAYLRDPDHSTKSTEQVRAQFRVFWTDEDGREQERTHTTSYKAANSRFYYQLPDDIPESTTLGWIVRANDGHAWSPWSWSGEQTRCELIYDSTAPNEPGVESWEYPNDDQWHPGVGMLGQIHFSSSEDVDYFRYGVNENPSEANRVDAEVFSDESHASIDFLPERTGPHHVTVEAVDHAGNSSTRANYLFLVDEGSPASPHYLLSEPEGSDQVVSENDEYSNYTMVPGSGVTLGGEGPEGSGLQSAFFDGTAGAYLQDEQMFTPFGYLDSSWSWSVWVKLEDLSKDQSFLSQDASEMKQIDLGYSSAEGQLEFSTWDYVDPSDFTSGKVQRRLSYAVTSEFTTWSNLTVVHNSHDGSMLFYVNGVLVDDDPEEIPVVEGSPSASSGAPAPMSIWNEGRIGRSYDGEDFERNLHGYMADVRIFSRVVMPYEVRNLYELPVQRRAYWNFTETVDGAAPEFGGGPGMQLHGAAEVFMGDPFGDSALVGDGHLNLGGEGHATTAESVAPTDSSFTLSLRARLASAQPEQNMSVLSQAGQTQSPFDVRYSAEANRWELLLAHEDTSGSGAVNVINDLFVPSSEQSGDHLAVVYDAFSREMRFYVNGQLSQTSTVQHSSPWASTGPLSVGRSLTDGAWGSYFSGSVDDVRVYRGAADATLIAQLSSLTEQPDL